MPKIKFLDDYTVKDKQGATYRKDKVYEVSDASANHFINRRRAEYAPDSAKAEEPTYAGEPPAKRESDASTTRAVETRTPPSRTESPAATTSPVADLDAQAAKEAVARKTSKELLQAVIDHDERVTVQKAAEERLAELNKPEQPKK